MRRVANIREEPHSSPVRNTGPVYSQDGRLILDESFTAFEDMESAIRRLNEAIDNLEDGWLVEVWRIWDCDAHDWADFDLEVRRYESADVVIRKDPDAGACIWVGAVDNHGRVIVSRGLAKADEFCWQWSRDDRSLQTSSRISREPSLH